MAPVNGPVPGVLSKPHHQPVRDICPQKQMTLDTQVLDPFSAGAHASVCELALSIVVLADRISMLIEMT
jgi:hypothetical protein